MSTLWLPEGLFPTTVAAIGVKVPSFATLKPEIESEPEFEVYTHFPSGVSAAQQFPPPKVGTAELMGAIVPSLLML